MSLKNLVYNKLTRRKIVSLTAFLFRFIVIIMITTMFAIIFIIIAAIIFIFTIVIIIITAIVIITNLIHFILFHCRLYFYYYFVCMGDMYVLTMPFCFHFVFSFLYPQPLSRENPDKLRKHWFTGISNVSLLHRLSA